MLSGCSQLLSEVKQAFHTHFREGVEMQGDVIPRAAEDVRGGDRTRVSGVAH